MSNQTGVGVPTQFAPIQPITTPFGTTVQLSPVLLDVTGVEQTPTQQFVFKSSNTALVTVDADGLCTVASPQPTDLPAGGTVEIQILYPAFGNMLNNGSNIYTSVFITVTANDAVSAYVPQAPGITLEQAENSIGATPHGAGWKAIASDE